MTTKTRVFDLFVLLVAALAAAPLAADSFASTDSFLPVVHTAGASGTWVSDVTVFNPNAEPAKVTFYFTAADTDGSGNQGYALTPDLAPGETLTIQDFLPSVYRTTGYGSLEVQSLSPIIVTGNTINVAANCTGGNFGQFSPGQPARNAIGYGTTTLYDLFVVGVPNDATHRTNATVMNPTSFPLHATMELVSAGGTRIGQATADVPPYSLHQFNDLFGSVFAGANPAAGASWRLDFYVNAGNGARLLAYVTIIDVRSGDPYLVTASAQTADVPSSRPLFVGAGRDEALGTSVRTTIETVPVPPRR